MSALRFLVAVITLAAPLAAAHDPSPGESWTRSGAGWVSGSVSHVETYPLEGGGAVDAVLLDDLLYLTSWRSFSIYDVSDPLAPRHLSTEPLVVALWNEQPQTDGEILLISRDAQYLPPTEEARGGGVLDIYDVSDPEDPALLATYESELTGPFATHRDHLWTCVLDCDYAYGAGGTILDLRDPATPARIGNWTQQAPIEALHHIAEVAPGVVLTGSVPMYVLDAREDPSAPSVLATVDPEIWDNPPLVSDPVNVPNFVTNETALPGRVDWPGALSGRLAVATIETPFVGECTDAAGDVRTFLTPGWRDTGTFQLADTFQIAENGSYEDGAPPYNAFGCSAYGLDIHPSFGQQGGPAAVSFFEHGIRVLEVDAEGRISEEGGFLPFGGNSTRPLWVSDEILYSVDVNRGIDILRVERER